MAACSYEIAENLGGKLTSTLENTKKSPNGGSMKATLVDTRKTVRKQRQCDHIADLNRNRLKAKT